MARNLFNTGDNRTSISDSEKAAFGSGTVNAFNVTWGVLKGLIKTYLDAVGISLTNTTGTLADGNLSSNVALRNIDNKFPTTTFGTNNSTNGTNFILGNYAYGNVVAFGAEFGSSNPFIGYGIRHNENSVGFISSTPINIPRSYLKLSGTDLRIGLASMQATAEGSPITGLTEKIIYHSGNSNSSTVDWNAKNIVASGKVTATKLNLSSLPTSAAGLVSGDVWRNGTVLNIVI